MTRGTEAACPTINVTATYTHAYPVGKSRHSFIKEDTVERHPAAPRETADSADGAKLVHVLRPRV